MGRALNQWPTCLPSQRASVQNIASQKARATLMVRAPLPAERRGVHTMAELLAGFQCRACGQFHDVLPLSFSVKAPLAVTRIPLEEIEQRVVITKDQCVIDGTKFFLRGRIVVPIIDLDEPFIWGVWAEISPKTFIRTQEQWNTEGREFTPPDPGWLDTELPLYGNTINLEVDVYTQVVGRRPHFTVIAEDNPLAIEQRTGITLARVEDIAATVLHPQQISDTRYRL
jgi:hypothetical protein